MTDDDKPLDGRSIFGRGSQLSAICLRQPVHTAGRAAAAIAYAVAMGADPSPAGELAAQTERRWSQQQLQAALDIRR